MNKNTLLVGGEGYIGVVVRDFFLKKKIKIINLLTLILRVKLFQNLLIQEKLII